MDVYLLCDRITQVTVNAVFPAPGLMSVQCELQFEFESFAKVVFLTLLEVVVVVYLATVNSQELNSK